MTARKNVVKENEIKLAEAKHQLEISKIEEKHRPKAKTPTTRKPANG